MRVADQARTALDQARAHAWNTWVEWHLRPAAVWVDKCVDMVRQGLEITCWLLVRHPDINGRIRGQLERLDVVRVGLLDRFDEVADAGDRLCEELIAFAKNAGEVPRQPETRFRDVARGLRRQLDDVRSGRARGVQGRGARW
jgi:hypothetical protein